MPGWDVRGLTRKDLELSDLPAVEQAFAADPPDLIIHSAAMSRADECARDPAGAWLHNVDVTRGLSRLASDRGFLLLSTDLVLDGRKGNYVEEDPVNPPHVYGETKAEAERIVLANPRHAVVRAALNLGRSASGNRAFNEQMRAALTAGRTLSLFTDEFRSPIATPVVARAVWELARQDVGGLFLLGGAERVSRWEIGRALLARWGELRGAIQPASIRDYQGPPRPADLSLNCRKTQSLLSFPLPGFHEWLAANPDYPA